MNDLKSQIDEIKNILRMGLSGGSDSDDRMFKSICDADRLLPTIEQSLPEVVTVEDVIRFLEGSSANTDTDYRWRAATILREGLCIVQD